MKRLVLFFALLVLLFSSCDALDSDKCRMSVEKSFPDALEIVSPAGESHIWIVMDKDSSIYYVETMALFNAKMTHKELIFK